MLFSVFVLYMLVFFCWLNSLFIFLLLVVCDDLYFSSSYFLKIRDNE